MRQHTTNPSLHSLCNPFPLPAFSMAALMALMSGNSGKIEVSRENGKTNTVEGLDSNPLEISRSLCFNYTACVSV